MVCLAPQTNSVLPEIRIHEGIFVVRDDLYPGGSKARFIKNYMRDTQYDEYVYPGTCKGAAIAALGYAASETGKKAIVFIAERNEYNDIMQEAFDAGKGNLEFKYVKMGFYPKIKKACERYVSNTPNSCYLRSGFDMQYAVDSIAKIANNIITEFGQFDVVLTACSSGTLQRGIQKGGLAKRYIAVATGQKHVDAEDAEIIWHNKIQKFEANPPKELRPPYPTVLNYDGKVWQYALKERDTNPNARILVWNVWASPEQRALYNA